MDLTFAIPLLALSMRPVYGFLLAVIAIFIILLVLVQRGRGGGLAGALGGVGGSSAFGAKAGDVFTRITIGAATVWIAVCIFAAKSGGDVESQIGDDFGGNQPAAEAQAEGGAGEANSGSGEEAAAGESGSEEAGSSEGEEESAE